MQTSYDLGDGVTLTLWGLGDEWQAKAEWRGLPGYEFAHFYRPRPWWAGTDSPYWPLDELPAIERLAHQWKAAILNNLAALRPPTPNTDADV